MNWGSTRNGEPAHLTHRERRTAAVPMREWQAQRHNTAHKPFWQRLFPFTKTRGHTHV